MVDCERFDKLVARLKDELLARSMSSEQTVTLTVESLYLLLDYCAILRPLLDAVELGEVGQYRKGLEDGRRQGVVEGADRALEHVAERLENGAFYKYSHVQIAEYLLSLKSDGNSNKGS